MTPSEVSAWLERYVQAWKSYDPQAIGDLFSEDARYYYGPYAEPLLGREAIVASWLANQDAPSTYDAHYQPIMLDGSRAVVNGRSQYFQDDGKTPRTEFDNIFLLEFDSEGRCREFREWYMEKPRTNQP
ncbi:MAG: nuclear transport factor 2 family protein [bacterium]|nr:nuclear transport factor 2 family protein [bacterium]